MIAEEPTLHFFRRRPGNAAVASSMQSLESSFFLIALGRFPHALLICATAIEASLQQAVEISAARKDGLQALIKKAKEKSKKIAEFDDDDDELKTFRDLRNRITHNGFSPIDDSASVSAYLKVGLPLLALCYHEFHEFDTMNGLLQEYAEHLQIADRMHGLWHNLPNADLQYCLHSFGHLIRWQFRRSFAPAWEGNAHVHYEENGMKFEWSTRKRARIARQLGDSWEFECPICDEPEAAVAEIAIDSDDGNTIRAGAMTCGNCDFAVEGCCSELSQALLEKQISEARPTILSSFGIA